MKKVIVIAVILTLVVSGGVLWKIRENRLAAKAAYLEAKATEGQAYNKGLTKYEMGPADPQEILELVNQERARIGVAPLAMDENVQKSAQLKANDMEVKGYRQHIIPGTRYTLSNEMAYWINKSCSKSSENLIWRSDNGIETTGGAFDGWMGSEPHRKAIQNPKYTKTGIAVSPDKRIVVQHFCVP
jgi:BH1803 protein